MVPFFPDLFRKPSDLAEPGAAGRWFDRLAERMLNGSHLLVQGLALRLVEIEFYLHGPEHPDPFAHRHPVQQFCGRWYFHRTCNTYRNGSFKGLDLTFGDGSIYAGILIRGLESRDGTLIDGPSLCVDHLLKLSGSADVPNLDERIGERLAWERANPLVLEWIEPPEAQEIYRTARVGLTLKRATAESRHAEFLSLPYRYLTEPRRITKGKVHLIRALLARGDDIEIIHRLTGSPRASIRHHLLPIKKKQGSQKLAPPSG